MIFEEYISESYGVDLRLHVVGGKCVASVKRIAKEGDFRSNVTNGGKMYPHEATEQEKELAIAAAAAVKADFAGIDLLISEKDRSFARSIPTPTSKTFTTLQV